MDTARRILLKTSYFSLISGYKDTFKNRTTGKYIDGTTFDDIYRLYQIENLLEKASSWGRYFSPHGISGQLDGYS